MKNFKKILSSQNTESRPWIVWIWNSAICRQEMVDQLNALLSQGFGGNASAKLDGRRMLVKASGMRLSAVGPGKGYSVLEYPPIARLYSGRREADEKASTTRIAISVLAGGEKKP